MCWVAFDRAIRLAEKRSFPINPRWKEERDIIYNTIFKEFWNEKRQTFVQTKGSSQVDASTLLMPLVRFISPQDKKWLSTMRAIEEDLVSDSLVYRYKLKEDKEALHEGEGTFSLCSFWYIECLSRSGELDKAELYFEKILGFANHLGLYAEELSYKGEHLGNFPQGFTHLGLISAAYNLDQNLSKRSQ
jgi:GH15 family glucan-1,4-alpha-glucosidase